MHWLIGAKRERGLLLLFGTAPLSLVLGLVGIEMCSCSCLMANESREATQLALEKEMSQRRKHSQPKEKKKK